MNATYTVFMPEHRHRHWLGRSTPVKAGWLAAAGTLAISLPLALGLSFYLLAGDEDGEQDYALAQPASELTLPSLPESQNVQAFTAEPAQDSVSALAAAEEDPADVLASEPEKIVVAEAPVSEPVDNSRRVVRLEWGDTLAGLLLEAAVPAAEAHEAMAALRAVYDPREVQAGEEVVLRYSDTGAFAGFEFEPTADRSVRVERNGEEFKAASVLRPLSHNVMAASIQINGSLYESGIRAGIPASTMGDLIKALSYNVDFQRDIKAGDSFKVLFEVMRNPEGELVRTGQILFAEVNLQNRSVPVYRYRFSDGTVEYYDREGRSVRKALLRTPVNAARMSSGFGMRRHPVLGYTRMHKGTDFAAPTGTPIYAAGDGVIVERGVKNGYGNYIRIRHNSTMQTAYAHMSRFSPAFSRGSRVRQGQVIGYVGTTGRSTGPHLHYEVLINGAQVNPLQVANVNSGEPLRGANLSRLRNIVEAIDDQFEAIKPGLAVDAAFNATTGEPLQQPVSAPVTLPPNAEAKRANN